MNYLAHLYLSGDSEELLIGNYIGDSVRSSELGRYSARVQKGVGLHRLIDTFTDSHPTVQLSKERLRPAYGKYAGVIVDIFYDHFLARDWALHSGRPLKEYAQHVYEVIGRNRDLLPQKADMFYYYMKKNDILNAYAQIAGVSRVLTGMASRANFKSNMEQAVNDLSEHYSLFEAEFREFFPLLKKEAEKFNL